MHVSYFINQHPEVSHIFIRSQIIALQCSGVSLQRLASSSLKDKSLAFQLARSEFVETHTLAIELLTNNYQDKLSHASNFAGNIATQSLDIGLSKLYEFFWRKY